MEKSEREKETLVRWNRKLLSTYWMFVISMTAGETANLFLAEDPAREFIIESILRPTAIFLLIMGLSEWVCRRIDAVSPLPLILSGCLLATAAVWVHSGVDSILLIYMLPLLVSVFYFQKKYVYLTSALNLISFLLLYMLDPVLDERTSAVEVMTTVLILGFGGPYTAAQIMDRGVDLVRNLKIDALTGLYNHISFHDFLDRAMERFGSQGSGSMLAVVDIDMFKSVNDSFGHQAGDLVLRRVAAVIREHTGPGDIAARYGGEEFALLMPGRSQAEAYALCESIREALAAAVHPELDGRRVTISVGLCGLQPGMDKEAWFQRADELLYRAKREGRNRTEAVDSAQ
ncbi:MULTISPECIES: GGDEF domain-containing protein [Paenibacillus]|uniref:GGDEF domain-containing protein n=1 Tax=Paenibacillus TaxID=44249 RepID=UPI0022B92522|nr:GGDEF domain-containing protein [Paenibacillus caseinilyticus]MCZ8522237.1 GGDEF domain-containing protein [Paenibacillus caseinilyticus]